MVNQKILIVEDDAISLNVLRDKLSKEGFEVLGAPNGKQGLELALKAHPDLIMADIVMPVMDGTEMIKKLREDEWGKKVMVIILTNLNSDKSVADFLEKGAFDYLVKENWSLEEVVKRVKEKLRQKF